MNVLETTAVIGKSSLGFLNAGFEIVGVIEIDDWTANAFNINWISI